MKKSQKELPDHDILAAILKVKPTADMPRPGAQPTKHKGGKKEGKPTKR